MTDRVETVVIGAGVIGLAVARALALEGHEVLVLEAEKTFGTQTSSRNSEVIHAGIYYPANSLKAHTCVSGKALLYDYCSRRGIDFQRTGKLIIATCEQQLKTLRGYRKQGRLNGVVDLELLSAAELHQLEPEVRGVAALLSPSTGIVDSHALMLTMLGDIESSGGILALRSQVRGFKPTSNRFEVEVEVDGTNVNLQSRYLINAAGHGALSLARAAGMNELPNSYFPAGHYFSYSCVSPFNHLIYPVAEADSLGVHATLDLGGQVKFGPDLVWREQLSYRFESEDSRRQYFENQIRKYYPSLDGDRLHPAYVGVRPRITARGEPEADFMIAGVETHGIEGLVQLFGIESPGLTACLAIAEQVVNRLNRG